MSVLLIASQRHEPRLAHPLAARLVTPGSSTLQCCVQLPHCAYSTGDQLVWSSRWSFVSCSLYAASLSVESYHARAPRGARAVAPRARVSTPWTACCHDASSPVLRVTREAFDRHFDAASGTLKSCNACTCSLIFHRSVSKSQVAVARAVCNVDELATASVAGNQKTQRYMR